MHHDEEYEVEEPYVVIERRSSGVGSFLWGLAIGAGAALLLAPSSGAETRRQIGRGARRVRTAARDTAEGLTDSVVDRYELTRQRVEDGVGSARRALDLKRRQASEAIRAGREAAQQAREDLERRIAETRAAYQAGADVARGARRAPTGEVDGSDVQGGA